MEKFDKIFNHDIKTETLGNACIKANYCERTDVVGCAEKMKIQPIISICGIQHHTKIICRNLLMNC